MENPLLTHWSVVKRIQRYLNSIVNHSLTLALVMPLQKLSLRVYSDSRASDSDKRRSTSGSCVYFFFGLKLVSWNSKKNPACDTFKHESKVLYFDSHNF